MKIRSVHAPQTDSFAREAKAAFAQHLDGAEPAGPFMLIFHGVVDEESDGPLQAGRHHRADPGPGS